MPRPTVIAGNWKMHGDRASARALAQTVVAGAGEAPDCEILLCPPYVHLLDVLEATKNSPVGVGAQNVCDQTQGAYTGEISVGMLTECGCDAVIIGHSERRHVYGESDELIGRKFALLHQSAQENPDTPRAILCVGETLEEREAGQTLDVIRAQLQPALDCPEAFPRAWIAYEPVWAIGTGVAATPDMAQEVHAAIRQEMTDAFGSIADEVIVLYGGSVKPDNAGELFPMPDIDGGLIGGASLDADSFLSICENVRK